MEKEKTNDWSQLPWDLIALITNRLGAIEDFVAFSSTCTSWRSALRQQNWSKRCVPWLLVQERGYRCQYLDYLLIPSINKKNNRHDVKEPLITEANHRWGSSVGWIFNLSIDKSTRLTNPITGLQIALPRLPLFIQRALVFVKGPDNDNNNGNIFVFVISYDYPGHCRLAFARPGFNEWITLHDPENGSFRDIHLFSGVADVPFYTNKICGIADVACYEDMILGVRANGALVTCETDNLLYPRVTNFAPPPEFVNFDNVGRLYLIESAADLLMVLVRRDFGNESEAFEVYKFDMESRRWGKLDDLGDRALFLGDNYSISVSHANGDDCISNCIYTSTRIGLLIFYMKDRQPMLYDFPSFSEKSGQFLCPEALSHLLNPYFGGAWVTPTLS